MLLKGRRVSAELREGLKEQIKQLESKLAGDTRRIKVERQKKMNSKLAYALEYAHQTLKGNNKRKELEEVSKEVAELMKNYSKVQSLIGGKLPEQSESQDEMWGEVERLVNEFSMEES